MYKIIFIGNSQIEASPESLTINRNLCNESLQHQETSVSVKEASQMIGISEQSIRLWLRSGKIKGHLVGGSYKIDMDSIKEVLAGN